MARKNILFMEMSRKTHTHTGKKIYRYRKETTAVTQSCLPVAHTCPVMCVESDIRRNVLLVTKVPLVPGAGRSPVQSCIVSKKW